VRLLLDEMLSPRIARLLRHAGHDVVAVKEREEWRAADDDRVIEIARHERRAIVTDNMRDYRPRAAAASLPGGPGHHGMVFVPGGYRRTRADTGRIVAALEQALQAHPDEHGLHNQETWL
jgi:hypothetical protein